MGSLNNEEYIVKSENNTRMYRAIISFFKDIYQYFFLRIKPSADQVQAIEAGPKENVSQPPETPQNTPQENKSIVVVSEF